VRTPFLAAAALLAGRALAETDPLALSTPPPPPPAATPLTKAPPPPAQGAVAVTAPTAAGPAAAALGSGPPVPAGAPLPLGGQVAPSAPPAPQAPFVKGELSNVGRVELEMHRTRFGVRVGYEYLDGYDYLRTTPQVDLRFDELRVGLGFPMRLEMCRGDVALAGCVDADKLSLKPYERRWRFRSEDYRTASDWARLLRYATWGRKEDRFYLNVGQENAATIGHGGVMRRYFPSADAERPRVSGELDAYNDYGGFEAFANDVVSPNLLAALAFVKPLSFLSQDPMARSFSVGVTWAADLRAPTALRPGAELALAQDPASRFQTRAVQAVGVDAEVKLVKTEAWDLKPYVEWAHLAGAGSGASFGLLTRASFGGTQALRLIVEGRRFDANYLPAYFDTFYEVQRVQNFDGHEDPTAPPQATKWASVSSRTGPARLGYYLELSWAWIHHLSLSAGLDTATQPLSRSAYLHAEVPALSWLQLFATYHRRSFQGQPWFTRGSADLPTTVFFSGARLRLLPILFVNATASQTWAWDPALARYQSARGFFVDVELGWEFEGTR